jgi:hypothetical protein
MRRTWCVFVELLTQAPRRLAIVGDITLRYISQVDGRVEVESKTVLELSKLATKRPGFGEAAGLGDASNEQIFNIEPPSN